MKTRTLVVVAFVALALVGPAMAGPPRSAGRTSVPKTGIAMVDPFKNLLAWAKRPDDGYKYWVGFAAVSNDPDNVGTWFTGRFTKVSGNSLICDSTLQYFSNRTWAPPSSGDGLNMTAYPFNPNACDKVRVELDCANKFVRLTLLSHGGKKVLIPLTFEKGVYRGVSAPGTPVAGYVFTFKMNKDFIPN